MDIENEVVENRNRIKMSELRVQALIKLLTKEGIVTSKEVETELKKLLEAGDEAE